MIVNKRKGLGKQCVHTLINADVKPIRFKMQKPDSLLKCKVENMLHRL